MVNSTTMPSLRVENLSIAFGQNKVVDNLHFSVQRGKTTAIVGESGSGKSVSSLAIMGLLPYMGGKVTAGSIAFYPYSTARSTSGTNQTAQPNNHDQVIELTTLHKEAFRKLRGNDIAMIFQEPMTSLDPVFTIGNQIKEALILHRQLRGQAADQEAQRLLDKVHIPNAKDQLKRYPHQLSGGMRQRVMIAMALASNPQLLIADEPTTALDVTIQAQILQIIRELQTDQGTSVIFISHDMGVVSEMADEIVVMNQGQMIEQGSASQVILEPTAAYTKALMAAVPKIGTMQGKTLPEPFDLIRLDTDQAKQTSNSGGQSTKAPLQQPALAAEKPLIEVKNLTTRYDISAGFFGRVTHRVHAAESINFTIYPGETLALVGESGSGKSTVGKTLQQLVEPASGEVYFRGNNMLALSLEQRQQFKKEIQYIFQDPYGSLNPRKTVRASLLEPMRTHHLITDPDKQIAQLLESVNLPADFADRYPHEFSGGQRQRICIARALACSPKLIIADEAVSALDVSVQAQVINLLMKLQAEHGLAYLFISHDMAVIERISHRVAVMYLGQIVEIGTRQQIFERPQHPYTQRLLAAVPILDPHQVLKKQPLITDIPSPVRPVDEPPRIHQYHEIESGHFVADNASHFNPSLGG